MADKFITCSNCCLQPSEEINKEGKYKNFEVHNGEIFCLECGHKPWKTNYEVELLL